MLGGECVVGTYRLYCMDGAGKIDLADWIEAADDEEAIRKARALKANSSKCEVWQGARLIRTLGDRDLAV